MTMKYFGIYYDTVERQGCSAVVHEDSVLYSSRDESIEFPINKLEWLKDDPIYYFKHLIGKSDEVESYILFKLIDGDGIYKAWRVTRFTVKGWFNQLAIGNRMKLPKGYTVSHGGIWDDKGKPLSYSDLL